MSRIRSIHPGFFTDEDLVVVSAHARLLFIGLLTECDDNGVFEWKPVTIKMKIFPAESIEIPGLLLELESAGAIQKIELEGRCYGVMRNFCKFQHPKKPTIRTKVPDQYRTYVGLTNEGTEPDPPSTHEGTELEVDIDGYGSELEGVEGTHGGELVGNQFGTSGEPVPYQFRTSGEPVRKGYGKVAPDGEEEGRGEVREKKERKKESKQEPSPTAMGARARAKYYFESGVIRLSEKDFKQWEQSFRHLSLSAELIALTDWAQNLPEGRGWFAAISNALNKKNCEMGVRLAKAKEEARVGPNGKQRSGIEGVV